ncbi:hypothetical protein BJX68DRAFT_231067 [Aspergillus pseudodeflectus]|uniref:Zn(2)-C6 fungal-type domain-containing protein n=1 Tax=Aspergillus pseudodeflectus TaxID=176178 RepID=A0ABR4KWQ1_9EURO
MTPSPPLPSKSRSRSRTPPNPNATGFGPLRSRRGCKTCKTRRVKCGEEKPTCLRCSSTGRKCEYEDARFGTYSSAPASTVVSLLEFDKPRSPSSSPPGSSSSNSVWRERRAFAYYFQHAASFVGGLDADFWSTVVPQVCRIEPAVWDAIIALSAMFENREEDSHSDTTSSTSSASLTENRRDALAWYSRAVSAVRLRIERGFGDVFIGLISCVLFICIEALQGSTEEAIRLYAQGVQLIVALRAQIAAGAIPASKASLLEDTIVPIFVRLAIMALTVSGVSVENLVSETAQLLTGFASLKAAREALVLLTIEIQQFQGVCEEHHAKVNYTSDMPPEFLTHQAALFNRLRNWYTAFTALTNTLRLQMKNETLPPKETSTIALLCAYHEMAYTITAICISPRKTLTDNYLQNFQNIVDHSRIALDASARSDGSQPPFTFDIGVGFPIWFTCLRCADPGIRRQALALLRRAPQVEGFYGNATITVSAEAIMVIEESLAVAINAVREKNPGGNADTSHISIFDVNGFAVTCEGQITALPVHVPTTLAVADIPDEARIKPLVPFRPRDGIPPGLTNEHVERWGRASDCWFLLFSRLDRDRDSAEGGGNGSWREVFDCIPAEMYP